MRRSWSTILLIGGLAILLAALGALQYRWLTKISAADGEKEKVRVREQAERFAADFNREIQGAYFNFQADAETWKSKDWRDFNERYQYWLENTNYPSLIREFYFFPADPEASILRYDEGIGFSPVDLLNSPAEILTKLQRLKDRLAEKSEFKPVHDDLDTLFLPIHTLPPKVDRILVRARTPDAPDRANMPDVYGHLAIELDRETLARRLIPDLAGKYFDPNEFRTQVTDKTGNTIFREPYAGNSDATAPLFDVSPQNMIFFANKDLLNSIGEKRSSVVLNSKVESHRFERNGEAKTSNVTIELKGSKPRTSVFTTTTKNGEVPSGPWQLGVTHVSGSVDAYIASTLRRNLAIGFGILLLLAGAIAAIIISSMRAKAFAQRQVDFVSSVSHEFRTPLAVISSAGENLADGVAKDESQVARYGDLIKGEGRKLSAMVEQILDFAGANSGKRKFNFTSVNVSDIVESALAECRPLIEDKGFEVETDVAAGLPEMNADKGALSQAIQNLVQNSIKYSNGSRWLRLAAANGDGKVKITVEDRGLGISKSDMKQIFEPFYRSREVVDAQIHGNGLGLSLVKQIVEAHGGRVTASSGLGQGSIFVIELPQS